MDLFSLYHGTSATFYAFTIGAMSAEVDHTTWVPAKLGSLSFAHFIFGKIIERYGISGVQQKKLKSS